ncbi:MAG: ABC transporter substrate-binding protein, partial [Halobacteriaceae archaeon]
HMQVGLYNPVLKGLLSSDTFLNHDNIKHWPDKWWQETIPTAIDNMERFGFRNGNVFPEIGQITGNYLITEAINEVINGNDPEMVATAKAKEMRNLIK